MGFEVKQLPANFDYALADGGTRKTVARVAQTGRAAASRAPACHGNVDQLSAALLLPAGYRGPAFLVLDNFRAILKYNNSSSYALAVGLLSEQLRWRWRDSWRVAEGSAATEPIPAH